MASSHKRIVADALRKAEQKLKAVKEIIDEWGRERDDGDIQYDWYYKEKYYALRKILEAGG